MITSILTGTRSSTPEWSMVSFFRLNEIYLPLALLNFKIPVLSIWICARVMARAAVLMAVLRWLSCLRGDASSDKHQNKHTKFSTVY